MFSDIQNIRSASEPLKTEAVDSRLGNKKRDDNNQKLSDHRKNEAPGEESTLAAEPDNAKKESVNRFSLDSLIYFLEDFLEEHIVSHSAQKNEVSDNLNSELKDSSDDISTMAPWLRSKHVNSNKNSTSTAPSSRKRNTVPPRYAAHAYAHRALSNSSMSQSTLHRAKPRRPLQRSASLPTGDSREEIGNIYSVISDLRALKERGTTHLEVKDNAALLEGISAAIHENSVS